MEWNLTRKSQGNLRWNEVTPPENRGEVNDDGMKPRHPEIDEKLLPNDDKIAGEMNDDGMKPRHPDLIADLKT